MCAVAATRAFLAQMSRLPPPSIDDEQEEAPAPQNIGSAIEAPAPPPNEDEDEEAPSTLAEDNEAPPPFCIGDRVCCYRGRPGWCLGVVSLVDEPLEDPLGHPTDGVIPYVVMLDGTQKLVSVPADDEECIVPEMCWPDSFAASEDGPLPPRVGPSRHALRFAVGDHVVCLVAAGTWRKLRWAAGVVAEQWAQCGAWGAEEAAAYRICVIDSGYSVLAYRDDHSLVRDPKLQHEGPCTREGRERFQRKRGLEGDGWETVDQQTRRVRTAVAPPAPSPARAVHGEDDGDWALELLCGDCCATRVDDQRET